MAQPTTDANGHVEKIHWPSLIAAISAISAVGIAIGLGLPLLSIILEKRGISSTLIGLNAAMAGVASMVAAPITTKIAHDCGVARTMMFAVLIAAISAIGFYYADAFWMWFPLRFTFHGATTTLFILSEFWINEAAPPRRRGLVLGIYATVLAIGFAIGPLLFSALGSDGVLPFLVGAAIIMLAIIPIFIARHESPVLDTKPDRHFFHYIFLVPTATAAVFAFGAVSAGGLSLFPIYAIRSALTEAQAALLLTVMGIGNMAFQIPLGLYSDKLRDRRPLLTAMAVLGVAGSLALPFLIQNWIMMAVVLFFWGGCVSGLYTVGLAHLGSRLSGADLAAANAAFIFCYAVGTVAGPQGIGAAIDIAGNDGFAWALAGFFGFYVLVSICRMLFRSKRS
ncbi:Putative MFS-type transporter YfkF [Neorhizobium galegae bv. officinalis bv. officinalis str. HAMBI 1141]|uniref:Putative MFS-type transporter YfkF n=1 Tax=Neorhizobium galegae bv. officinalis bv. officinalis str. HAMBI 1141 TaxID=1028801 RepID=A0A068T896_NEOGA|nr:MULTISPECIES: MFS transporter [Neorhizobium]MCJ9671115.1 MFS transporter [Neorhizobium sp. SHOUNA12B]MCJ9746203.1 MFS transporter [Neorhizobium sp. SHOUNA12A]MCJ9754267.1 MFS transporter [Neorhizobium sp. BETTINA12A]CDN53565.1 Putative MFS-type transporter YfkF [Neorhizobium galegae bv. officinalis bv. officinalis str. HAMBI 1141]